MQLDEANRLDATWWSQQAWCNLMKPTGLKQLDEANRLDATWWSQQAWCNLMKPTGLMQLDEANRLEATWWSQQAWCNFMQLLYRAWCKLILFIHKWLCFYRLDDKLAFKQVKSITCIKSVACLAGTCTNLLHFGRAFLPRSQHDHISFDQQVGGNVDQLVFTISPH